MRPPGEEGGHSQGDTAALLATLMSAKPEQEVATISLLDGMFAFGLWNSGQACMLLARDIAGEKPLYTLRLDRYTLAACSTAAGLIRLAVLAGNPLKIDPLGIALWLKHGYSSVMPLAGLSEVAPGTAVRWGAGRGELLERVIGTINARDPRPEALELPEALNIERGALSSGKLASLLAAVMATRLEADVPMGCLLSGGVDSSVVAALAQRKLLETGRGPLQTFCLAVDDPAFDESSHAAAVAKHLGTRHTTLSCEQDAAADMLACIAELGLPFGDSSILPTTWVSRAVRPHVTVALGGDGGDELFAGYSRYEASRLIASRHPLALAALLTPVWAAGLTGKRAARMAVASKHLGYHDLLTIFTSPELLAVVPGASRHGALAEGLTRWYRDRPTLADARHDDFAAYLPQDLMRKVDTASMSVALEVRSPLLARSICRTLLSVDLFAARGGTQRKGLLRAVARELVPAKHVDRPKQGFGVPIGRWIAEDFGKLGALALDCAAGQPFDGELASIIDGRSLSRMLTEQSTGDRDYGQRAYAMMALVCWSRWLSSISK